VPVSGAPIRLASNRRSHKRDRVSSALPEGQGPRTPVGAEWPRLPPNSGGPVSGAARWVAGAAFHNRIVSSVGCPRQGRWPMGLKATLVTVVGVPVEGGVWGEGLAGWSGVPQRMVVVHCCRRLGGRCPSGLNANTITDVGVSGFKRCGDGLPDRAFHKPGTVYVGRAEEASRCPSGLLKRTPSTGSVCPVRGGPMGWPGGVGVP